MGDENKKYVPEGVYLVCDKGTIPTQLICDPQEINIYSVRYADENDNKPEVNIPSFAVCKTLGTCVPPPGLTWTKLKTDVTLHGFHPLLEDSECLCPTGVGIIKIFFDKYEAELAAENNSESSFVSEPLSSTALGMALLGPGTGQLMALIAPDFTEGVGRGFKKGAEGTWNLLKDIWNKPGETLGGMATGLGKMAVIGLVYGGNGMNPGGTIQSDMMLRSLDARFGTDFTQTRDALVTGVGGAVENAVENVRRGNWGEVGEDIGQIDYAVVEAVVGSKGAGLAMRGLKTGAQVGLNVARGLIGAERLAQIAGKSAQVLNRIKFAASGIVRIGRRIEFEPNTLGTTGGNIILRSTPEVIAQRAGTYADLVNSNRPWTWADVADGNISRSERALIRQSAADQGLVRRIPVNPVTRYADFSGHIVEDVQLPRQYWGASDDVQFRVLNEQIGGARPGHTWHHHQDPGRMQLVEFGVHNATNHVGGRQVWTTGSR